MMYADVVREKLQVWNSGLECIQEWKLHWCNKPEDIMSVQLISEVNIQVCQGENLNGRNRQPADCARQV
jgi:hypothetical protein